MTDNLRDIALRQAAACAREAYAGEEKRIERGLLLALNDAVALDEEGAAQVRSDRDPEILYTVRQGQCECPDRSNAPGMRCKHRWAVIFTIIAQGAMRRTA